MERFITTLIIAILWGVLSTLAFMPNASTVHNLEKDSDKMLAICIFLIGGPFFAISNILEELLESICTGGWGGDDDDFFGRY